MALTEIFTSRTMDFAADGGVTAKRVFKCFWPERLTVKPNIGDAHPDLTTLLISKIRLEPLGKSVAGGGYSHCKIITQYTTQDYVQQQEPEAYVKESLDISGEMIRIFGGEWMSDGLLMKREDGASVFYPEAEYVAEVTVDDINEWLPRLLKNTGKVNSAAWKGQPAEKWLFIGTNTSNFQDEDGNMRWILSVRFLLRPGGNTWQQCWHPEPEGEGGKWDEPKFANDAKLYKTTNFNALFRGLI